MRPIGAHFLRPNFHIEQSHRQIANFFAALISKEMSQRGSISEEMHSFYALIHLSEELEELVELSGCCPPSPKSRTKAFSRLSFEFCLLERTPQSVDYRSQQTLFLTRP